MNRVITPYDGGLGWIEPMTASAKFAWPYPRTVADEDRAATSVVGYAPRDDGSFGVLLEKLEGRTPEKSRLRLFLGIAGTEGWLSQPIEVSWDRDRSLLALDWVDHAVELVVSFTKGSCRDAEVFRLASGGQSIQKRHAFELACKEDSEVIRDVVGVLPDGACVARDRQDDGLHGEDRDRATLERAGRSRRGAARARVVGQWIRFRCRSQRARRDRSGDDRDAHRGARWHATRAAATTRRARRRDNAAAFKVEPRRAPARLEVGDGPAHLRDAPPRQRCPVDVQDRGDDHRRCSTGCCSDCRSHSRSARASRCSGGRAAGCVQHRSQPPPRSIS